jgi:hypothetical protein
MINRTMLLAATLALAIAATAGFAVAQSSPDKPPPSGRSGR